MSWYEKDYRRRQIIAIDCTGGSSGSATIDVTVEIPKDWDDFWENIRSDFKDVVLTDSNGLLVDFKRSSANYSTRTLTMQINDLDIDNANSTQACYLYFFNPDETVDHAVTFTATSPKTGEILLSMPHSRIVSQQDSQSALDTPLQSFNKNVGDTVHVFFMISKGFAKRIAPYNERNDQEGLMYATVNAYNSSGEAVPTLFDARLLRFGNGFVRATFTAGTTGTDYAIAINCYTTLGQVFQLRAILRVIDLLP